MVQKLPRKNASPSINPLVEVLRMDEGTASRREMEKILQAVDVALAVRK